MVKRAGLHGIATGPEPTSMTSQHQAINHSAFQLGMHGSSKATLQGPHQELEWSGTPPWMLLLPVGFVLPWYERHVWWSLIKATTWLRPAQGGVAM